jgi:hypothetical protein
MYAPVHTTPLQIGRKTRLVASCGGATQGLQLGRDASYFTHTGRGLLQR